jgi:hypothetical protein
LDDLGFTANRVKEALGGVSLQAASMSQVMTAVTQLMNEDLQKTGGYAETAATSVGQLQTKWHELNVTVAEGATQPALLRFYDFILTNFKAGIDTIIGGQKRVREEMAKTQAVTEVQQFQEMHLTKEVLKDKQKTLDIVQQEANTRQQIIGRNNDEIKQLKKRFNELTNSGKMMNYQQAEEVKRIQEQVSFYGFKNLVLKESIRILNEYNKSLDKVAEKETTDSDEESTLTRSLRGSTGLKQVVDLDFKDPTTGEIKKFDRDTVIKTFTALANAIKASVPEYKLTVTPFIPMDAWDKIAVEFSERWRDIVTSGIMDVTDVINASIQAEADSYQVRLSQLQQFYDEQILLAGDNERAKKELALKRDREEQALRKKAFDAEKEAKRLQTIINGAAAIINAFATLPYPAAIVASALIAGQTASQIAVINKQQYRGFKDGVIDLQGPGTTKSDSIPARLSRGESVMTAEETQSSKNIFKAVRSKKLNDKILKEVVSGRSGGSVSNVFDDSKIVKELRDIKNSQPDIVKQNGMIYEARKKSETYKQYVRSKSM